MSRQLVRYRWIDWFWIYIELVSYVFLKLIDLKINLPHQLAARPFLIKGKKIKHIMYVRFEDVQMSGK